MTVYVVVALYTSWLMCLFVQRGSTSVPAGCWVCSHLEAVASLVILEMDTVPVDGRLHL